GGQARSVEGAAQEEVDGGRGAEAVEQVERVLDRGGVDAHDVGAEPDRGARIEERPVAAAGRAAVEIEVAGERERAEDRRRRVQRGQREGDGRADGVREGGQEDQRDDEGAHGPSSHNLPAAGKLRVCERIPSRRRAADASRRAALLLLAIASGYDS